MYAVAVALLLPTAMAAAVAGSDVGYFGGSQQAIQMPLQTGRALLEVGAAPGTDAVNPLLDKTNRDPEYLRYGSKEERRAKKQEYKRAKKAARAEKKAAQKAARAKKKAEQKAAKQARQADRKAAKAKKKGEGEFKWDGKGKNGFKWKHGKPRRIRANTGEVVYEQDGVVCRAVSQEGLKRSESSSAELHAAAGAPM